MIKLEIKNKNHDVLASYEGGIVCFTYDKPYSEGDYLSITAPDSKYWVVQLDSELKECMIYVPSGKLDYAIPYGEKLMAYGSKAFVGILHTIKIRYAHEDEIYSYRNIAINSCDKRSIEACYPRAVANFVTRDESVFEERNSIDGYRLNEGHGPFPYQSWGGGAREDVDYKLFFGRPVEVDKAVFYLRSDYVNDHDTYWKSLDIELSDGTIIHAEFEKTPQGQVVDFGGKKTITWLHLCNFKQAAHPLTWAALTEIEVYGNDVKK